MTNILAVIPARKGSKRVKRKNFREFNGKPLASWTIETALKTASLTDIIVSTDDEQFKELASSLGVLCPWLRPDNLSTDSATSAQVAIHAMNWYQNQYSNLDAVVLLQPTTPYREESMIDDAVAMFLNRGSKPLVSVTKCETHPYWHMTIEDMTLKPFFDTNKLSIKSNELKPVYKPNGSIYIIKPVDLLSLGTFYAEEMTPYVIQDEKFSLDIDTEDDWKKAIEVYK